MALLSFITSLGKTESGAAQALSTAFRPLLGETDSAVGRFEELLESVDAGRQGLPLPAFEVLAIYLEVEVPELRTVASLVEHGDDLPLHLHPFPPQIQSAVRSVHLAKTQPIPPAPALRKRVWTISATGLDARVRAFDLHSGTESADLLVSGCTNSVDFIVGGSKFWTVAGGGLHRLYAFNPDANPVALVLESTYEYPNTRGIAFDDVTKQLWVAQSTPLLARVDQTTGIPFGTGTLTDGVDNFEPREIAAAFGKVFVPANVVGMPIEGRLFVVDATDVTSYVVSVGIKFDSPIACAVENETTVWVVGGDSSAIYRITFDGLDWTASMVNLTGGNVGTPRSVEFFNGQLWVSGVSLGGITMLTQIDTSGVVLGQVTYPPAVLDLGRTAFDGVFPWAPETGELRRIHPFLASLATVLSVPVPTPFESFLACLVY